jgi:RHH-type transcriptional regulator, rel operon repressor / antitoxin RelB
MVDTISVTARIPVADKERLERLAMATGRTRGFLISRAIQDYLANQAWQIEEITKAVEEANAGELATEEETRVFFARWKV